MTPTPVLLPCPASSAVYWPGPSVIAMPDSDASVGARPAAVSSAACAGSSPQLSFAKRSAPLLLRSSNGRAYDWLVTHTDPDAHWFGRALVVEHGYIDDFVDRLRADGFTVVDI